MTYVYMNKKIKKKKKTTFHVTYKTHKNEYYKNSALIILHANQLIID